jgi:hypothetical protein
VYELSKQEAGGVKNVVRSIWAILMGGKESNYSLCWCCWQKASGIALVL